MKHDYSGILDFFRTGQLGELRLGMMLGEVVDYLGLPDSFGTHETLDIYLSELSENTNRWGLRYGCLSLVFLNSRILILEFLPTSYPAQHLPEPLNNGWLPLFSRMTPERFYEFKNKHSLEVYVEKTIVSVELTLLIIPNNIRIIFDARQKPLYAENRRLLYITHAASLERKIHGDIW